MYRAVERPTPEDIYVLSPHAFVEMLEAGFTQVTEFHHVHHGPKNPLQPAHGARGPGDPGGG